MTMPAGPRAEYDIIVEKITSTTPASAGKMFGMPCLKNDVGKAFAGFHDGWMVFKLEGTEHAKALALEGARLFDPSGRGRPMKEWVEVPPVHSSKWLGFAKQALRYSEQGPDK